MKTKPNDLKYEQERNPGYFLLVTCSEAISILVGPWLVLLRRPPSEDKKTLGKILRVEEFLIPASCLWESGLGKHADVR